ncbi:MAG: sulfatase, partial [Verrucomicrobia bacterium]|nr:sulfatase [Verrucomicrobiota bacterium]NDE97907.1 sulfatase [Verrucomicrobiota bacterium]
MTRKRLLAALSAFSLQLSTFLAVAADRPNILWLSSEDHGPHMGCYGDKYATTPNVDALAARGMIFRHAWSCAPVCAPARTTLISGLYPPSTGAEHMRSMVALPAGFKMYPQFLRAAGYYCSNNSKEDYNLAKPGQVWDDSSNKGHWKNRAAGQPFFAIFNALASHESQIRTRPHKAVHDPAKVRVPAYHPDTPEVRQDWAQYYDQVSEVDAVAGRHLKELSDAGLADDTIVFYWADHGSGMPRSKRWPCNSGLQVPVVVHFPEKWKHLAPPEYKVGGASDRLISFVDFAPTVLSLAGIEPPKWMQGHAFAGKFITAPQPFIYGFRGRMDERIDCVRSVTDGRYVYLRNFMPHVSQGQHVSYQFETPTTRVWHDLFKAGKTTEAQSIFWRTPKAPEELYDLTTDPDEVKNLAASPQHQAVLAKLRQAQINLLAQIRDVGLLPEGEIHSRSAGSAPYTIGHDDSTFPLGRIYHAASLASNLKADALPEIRKLLTDPDSAVRYWAALGVLMRGQDAATTAHADLQKALADTSPFVRIPAAQALGMHGDKADLDKALPVLLEQADLTKGSVFTAIAALNALGKLGPKAAPALAAIQALPANGPSPDGRYSSYVPRLLEDLITSLGGTQPTKE